MAWPDTPLGVVVELALGADLTDDPGDWAWTDVTQYVFTRETIAIRRGRGDRDPVGSASTCEFVADNRDGRWVPVNPTGAWYGQIGRGTPVRIKTTEGSTSVRWTGFLTGLPPRWDLSEQDRYVPVSATGIIGRLERGTPPAPSALRRTITHNAPSFYLPLEEGAEATHAASGLDDGLIGERIAPAAGGGIFPVGSAGAWTFADGGLVRGATGLNRGTATSWECELVVGFADFPSDPNQNYLICELSTPVAAGGTLIALGFEIVNYTIGDDLWYVNAYYSVNTGSLVNSFVGALGDLNARLTAGQTYHLRLRAEQVGANVEAEFYVNGVLISDATPPNTLNAPTKYTINPTLGGTGQTYPGANADGVCHLAIWTPARASASTYNAHLGWTGETASDRAIRLSDEEGVGVIAEATEVTMGPQPPGTFVDLLRECQAVANGELVERRDPTDGNAFLQLLVLDELTNQDPALELDHNSGHLSEPFAPTDDDEYVRNEWTVSRNGGASARAVAGSGNFTPARIGRYADTATVNVDTDDALRHQAGWRLNVSTAEGLRYPSVTIDLRRNSGLIASCLAADIGSRLTIANPMAGLPPDMIDLIIHGWTEEIGLYDWTVTLACSPYRPYRVFQLAETSGDTDDYLGRLAEDEACALRADITSGATSMAIDPNRTFWTEVADDLPVEVRLGGEVVEVSAIATTAATFIAAGAASHGDNSTRTPALPAGIQEGDLLVIFAAIRNTAATVNDVTGYERAEDVFPVASNCALFWKVAGASESGPSVAFTGGSAGDSTSAVMVAFRGTPRSLDALADLIVGAPVVQTNASAANIAYGGIYPKRVRRCIHVLVAWKQDDWTSVAPPSGFTEDVDSSTTSGNDQGIYVAHKIDGATPSLTPEGSLAVTGGAAAISKSALFAIASGYQTFTITRAVNGVTKAHTAGTRVEVEDPAVLAL